MDQDALRATLHTIIAERAHAGESLADVGATLAKLTDPPSKPPTRQYVQMLVAGKANITDKLARAILTLAAMQDDVPELQASAHLVTTPIYSLHNLPPNAIIMDPAHPCRLDGCRVEIIGRRAYCGEDHRREAARRRRRTPDRSIQTRSLNQSN
jgi:hypothetical protein